MELLQESFDYCAQICARSGSNFISAFRLLPRRERRAMEAVYAFMRLADDLADDLPADLTNDLPDDLKDDLAADSLPNARRPLEAFQNTFVEALQNPAFSEFSLARASLAEPSCAEPSRANSPAAAFPLVFPAVLETIRRYSIPEKYFLEVLRGVQTDLEKNFFRTVEELEAYCYHVASAVGLICLHIWGAPATEIAPDADSPLARAAVSCGKALQWTNILRDVVEDAQNDRLYLPLEDWDALFSSSQNNRNLNQNLPENERAQAVKNRILAGNYAELLPVIEKNLNRAEQFYLEAASLAKRIPRRNRNVFLLITSVYRQIFKKIRRNPEIIFKQRVKLSGIEKVKLYFGIFF